MRIKEIIMLLKLYFDRGKNYLSIVTFVGTVFMVVSQLSLLGIEIDVSDYSVIIILIGFIGIMFFGFLEVKYLFFAKEQEIKSMKNPVWIKLFDKIDHLEKKIDELERKDD
jgi:hypothetical protein